MILFFFFFKQKTAYEMRISDWSADVCSSDLRQARRERRAAAGAAGPASDRELRPGDVAEQRRQRSGHGAAGLGQCGGDGAADDNGARWAWRPVPEPAGGTASGGRGTERRGREGGTQTGRGRGCADGRRTV